jgi:Fe-S-cluster containining protein
LKSEDNQLLHWARQNEEDIKRNFRKWSKTKPRNLDDRFHGEHEQVFKKMDCLTCANCCKTTSPIFRDADIRRISKHLKMKEAQFISNYLKIDEDQDYVLKSSPCQFLGEDNYCKIYEVRPLACREYPHTDRKNMAQILDLTIQNTKICPAVSRIVQNLI